MDNALKYETHATGVLWSKSEHAMIMEFAWSVYTFLEIRSAYQQFLNDIP